MPADPDGSTVPEVHYALPPALAEHARAWVERGGVAAPTKDASTVMLVRDGEAGTPGDLEVFVLRRAATMAFAASAYVFPGGGVDDRDAEDALPWAGPSPQEWARRVAAPGEAQARELVAAAARELFEECGVLLAGPDESTVVADLTGPEWDEARVALVGREISFAEFLLQRGLVLRTDLLRAVDHWITPEFEPRRYDTRFFVAELPAGQVPDDDCTEAEHVRWVRPADLLAEQRAGQALLLPPTEVSLGMLAYDRDAHEAGGWDGSAASLMAGLDVSDPLPVVLPVPVLTETGVAVARRWAVAEGSA
jgi:8-oxo-dGTP pyrophosphatase MutT (NUDIX family)